VFIFHIFRATRASDRQSDTLESQVSENTEVTKSQKPDLLQILSEFAGQFPELIHLIERWPTLFDNIKEAIKALIQFENNHIIIQEDY
jgi:hypothetical protein